MKTPAVSFPPRARPACGLLCAVLVLLASGPLAAETCCADEAKRPTAACCPAPEKPRPPAACCAADPPQAPGTPRELPPGDFTAASLYQIDAMFTDDAGRPFALGSLRGRPVVLTMFFTTCSYACPLLVADMTRIRDGLPAEIRDRAALVLVSFDTRHDTPAVLRAYRESRALDPQWILLRGPDDSVRELAALLGVKFKQEANGQFAHSNLITILDREGEIVHQRPGLKGGLDEAGLALAATLR